MRILTSLFDGDISGASTAPSLHTARTQLTLHHCYSSAMASTSMQSVILVSSSGDLQSLQAIGYYQRHVPERSPRGQRDKLWRNPRPSHSAAGNLITTQGTSYVSHFQVLLCSHSSACV